MAAERILRIYLEKDLLDRARDGRHNFFNTVQAAFESRQFRVEYVQNSEAERLKSAGRRGYALFHMDDPFHPRALTARLAYVMPFWRIEESARRWEWPIARASFEPETVDADAAAKFARNWRNWLYGKAEPGGSTQGFVYAPLQGRLTEHRSFQSCSPLEMLRRTLEAEPKWPVIATLHPGESYTTREREALDALLADEPRLVLGDKPSETYLAGCNYIVTQNSAVAFRGLFFRKPAVTFAEIDFHHVTASVPRLGVAAAFEQVRTATPAYDRYLYWFLQLGAINAGRDDARERILGWVAERGWDVS